MDRQQFSEFVEAQQGALRAFLLHLCHGDSMTADDIAQEAFIKAWLALDSFGGRSKTSTWLFRIAYNCYIDRIRHESHHESVDPCEKRFADIPANEIHRHEELYLALDALSEIERTCTLLFYMEDMSVKDVASVTGLKTNTVKSHLRRARITLRQTLKNSGYEER